MTTLLGILSIAVGFSLVGAAAIALWKDRYRLAIGFGIAASIFCTFVPVILAVFFAVPNPS